MEKYTATNITDLKKILDEYGVAILENYFDDKYADKIFASVKQWLIGLNIGLTNDIATWTAKNVPFGPRYGMYQSIISHAPAFWNLRESAYLIFRELLGDADLLTSVDGASFYPTINSPKNKSTWAHIDQTVSSDFMCYQSQFVASETDASFVCTPKSHLTHAEYLKKFSINTPSNWHKFTDEQVVILEKKFGANYQIPIHAKPGSMIFWDSRTIHAAKYPDNRENKWRAVFYISMRPRTCHNDLSISTIKTAVENGLTTNHWGDVVFKPFDRFKIKNSQVSFLVKNSAQLSHLANFTSLQRKITGFDNNPIVLTSVQMYREQLLFLFKACLAEVTIARSVQKKIRTFIKNNIDRNNFKSLMILLKNLHQNSHNVDKYEEQIDKIIIFINN